MYSQDARDLCVRAYMKIRSLRRTSALLGISKSTVQRWIGSHPIARKRMDARKATHQAIQMIETILLNNPFEKPASISALIRNGLGVSLGTSTVRFWMKRRGLTRKKATRFTSTDMVHEKRRVFARDVSPVYDPERVVSIDESSFYFDMKPSHGYCNRSKRLRVPARPVVSGSINSIIFADFMNTLDTKERDVILLDNASIHKTHMVQDTMIARGLTPCFLPPYTPEFQPIEHCFSVVKNTFRRIQVPESDGAALKSVDMTARVEMSISSLTPMSLHNQFAACWRRAAEFLSVN